MVKRSEIVNLGCLWLEGHGRSEGSATLDLSSRVRRAALSIQKQSDESAVSSSGTAKTATLTMLCGADVVRLDVVAADRRLEGAHGAAPLHVLRHLRPARHRAPREERLLGVPAAQKQR